MENRTIATSIPQTSPFASYAARRAEIDEAVAGVLASGWYLTGAQAANFETEFAAYVGVRHALGVANGTDALQIALRACGVGAGDEVATVSHTASATVAAIELTGATPVLVDIDPVSYTMDPSRLEDVIRTSRRQAQPRLKAVVPVHLYGQPADMTAIMDLARSMALRVVEDCAQAHGAALNGRNVGTWGDIAAFSFYPTKNLAALGDAGAVATDDPDLADRARLIHQYGWRQRFVSDMPGVNSRLDEVQAAVLRVKLRYLEEENRQRERIASRYDGLLREANVELPRLRPSARHAFHQYVVRSRRRDDLRVALNDAGIGTAIHYPVPAHLQPAYRHLAGAGGPLTASEEAAREVLSLPMFPQLSDEEITRVGESVLACAQAR
jgi:dTDP-4-amino-4,6-dideoxygalactose transaminase